MKTKTRSDHGWRLFIDLWMTAGLMYSMGYQLFLPENHEWSGTVLLILFICHHVLNRRWYANLARGRYTPLRLASAITDAALLVMIVLLMWSGIAMSTYVFAFLPALPGMSLMRRLHLVCSAWAFVLMGLHLGLHWPAARLMKHVPLQGRRILFWLSGAGAAYGLWAFISRDYGANMFLINEFAFLDFGESPVLFYTDYFAIFLLFIFLGYGLRRLLSRRTPNS